MAIQFKNVRSTTLDMQDKIAVGKLQGCRVCDVIDDDYEYLIWADKSGLMKFTTTVVKAIQKRAGYQEQQRHYDEEIKPWIDTDIDDVPF